MYIKNKLKIILIIIFNYIVPLYIEKEKERDKCN